MAFARDVAKHVIFMGDGVIVEEGTSQQIFEDPQKEQTKEFLSRFRNSLMGTAQRGGCLANKENPEGDDLIVAKADCPPQTPPFWPRLVHQDGTG